METTRIKSTSMDGVSGLVPATEGASVCPSCGHSGCTVHWNTSLVKDPVTGRKLQKKRYYCDCSCYAGVVTGWHDTIEDAVDAWNRGIWVGEGQNAENEKPAKPTESPKVKAVERTAPKKPDRKRKSWKSSGCSSEWGAMMGQK